MRRYFLIALLRFIFLILIVLLFTALFQKVRARYPLREESTPAAPSEINLPTDLLTQLKKDFPGFELAQKKDYCPQFEEQILPYAYGNQGKWSYNILQGDFNGDYLNDYSFIGKYRGQYILLAALQNRNQVLQPYQISQLGTPLIAQSKVKAMAQKICDGIFVLVAPNRLQEIVSPAHDAPIADMPGMVKVSLNAYEGVGIQNDIAAGYYYWMAGKWEYKFLQGAW